MSSLGEGTPLVSVIVPVYNSEAYLDEAIDSVFAQTYRRWEIVLVDDGSTDASPAAARRHAEAHPARVRYLEHPSRQNRGTSATRNLGLRQARGEYVAFLDADDVFLPAKLERQVGVLRSHPDAAMTYGPGLWWYSWTGHPADSGRDSMQRLGIDPDTLVRPPALLLHFLRNGAATPCTNALLARRQALERIGGFEETFQGLYDDQALYAKMSLDEPIFVEEACHARYRKHPRSLVARVRRAGAHGEARLAFLTWLEGYLSARGMTAGDVWTQLQQELWRYRHPRLHSYARRVRRVRSALSRRLGLLGRTTG